MQEQGVTTKPTTTHVVITWHEGHRKCYSQPYPIHRRTAAHLSIIDDASREITYSRRRSGNWVRKYQIDSVMSERVDYFTEVPA